jgi:cytochrome c-type biogenesis protein CcmH
MPQPSPDQVEAMSKLSPEERQKTIRAMVDGLEAKLRDSADAPAEQRDGWLRLANARKVLGDSAKASEAFAKADAITKLDGAAVKDWAEAEVRQIPPGGAPSAQAVAVLERLEKQEPNNALALFYLGAASFAQGDKSAAVKRWKTLLALLPGDAPIRSMLEARIKEAE